MANVSKRSGCPSCEGDAEDEEDYEVHTMETGAEYEMKVLSGTSRGDSKSSTSTNNDCHKCHMNGQVLVIQHNHTCIIYGVYNIHIIGEEVTISTA